MAEALLSAVAKIISAVGDGAKDAVVAKISNRKDLKENSNHIMVDLKMMHNVIQDLDTESLSIKVVKGWIDNVRKVAFRVEDVMDKYSYYTFLVQEEGSVMRFFKKTQYAKVFFDIADEVVNIMAEIQDVKVQQTEWLRIVQIFPKTPGAIDRRRSQGCFPVHTQDEDLVGINDNRMKLIGWLHSNEPSSIINFFGPSKKNSNEPNSTVITVSGMGGLGKSTLVANVYDRVKNSFGAKAWITVSQSYTIETLLGELLGKIGYTEKPLSPSMDIHELKQEIKSKLQGNVKCLVVLDDVWDKDVYTQMQDIFKNLQSSRVIITTRRDDVASLASSGHHLQVQPLNKDDAHRLFYARAFGNTASQECPDELKEVATKIVERCNGLPLAIVSMGSLLSSKNPTEHTWNQVFKQFRSELSRTADVQAILKLSYNDLPGELRNCFLHCSLFPEDYTMSRESLVRQWVAEGFALPIESSTQEEVAETYLVELISRNMLQVVDYDELGRVSTCKMHDIVRDLALSTAREVKFGSSATNQTEMAKMDKDVRRLSLCGWKGRDSKTGQDLLFLRTLMSLGAVTSTTQMLDSIFSKSCYLTVLELQDSVITEVPESIENMFNLRYIGLRRTRVKSLPECIEKLSNLETLDIKQTQIEKLPRGIAKVTKLRHLLADRVIDQEQASFQYFIGVQPPKDLSNLVELQTLETVDASDYLADQLEKLNQLQSIWIGNVSSTDSEKLFKVLSSMPLLSSLLLNATDENQALHLEHLKPESKQLHRLIIRGCWAARTLQCPIFDGHGKNLKYLALSWSGLTEDPLVMLAPHVPNLTYLSLNRASSAGSLAVPDDRFPKLKTLVLKNLLNVSHITVGNGALQNIQGVYIVRLPSLDKVPQGIESLTSLKKLWLLHLHKDFKAQWENKGMHQKMGYVLELKI